MLSQHVRSVCQAKLESGFCYVCAKKLMFFHQTSWPLSPKFMPYACLWFWGLSLHWWLGRVINSSSSVLWFIISVLVMCPGSCVTSFCQNKQIFGNSCLHCVVRWIILSGCFSTVGQYCDVISLSMSISLEEDSTSLVTCQGHVTLTWLGQETLWGLVTINPLCALDGFVFPLGYS